MFPQHFSYFKTSVATKRGNSLMIISVLVLKCIFSLLRPHLYGLRYTRQPSSQVTLAEATFILFLSKIQSTVYIMNANSSWGWRWGGRQLGWASCLTLAGRVTLASGTTCLHINTLARLPGTALSMASIT